MSAFHLVLLSSLVCRSLAIRSTIGLEDLNEADIGADGATHEQTGLRHRRPIHEESSEADHHDHDREPPRHNRTDAKSPAFRFLPSVGTWHNLRLKEPVPGDLPPRVVVAVDKQLEESMYKACIQPKSGQQAMEGRLKKVLNCPLQGHFNVLKDDIDPHQVVKNVELGNVSTNSFVHAISRQKQKVLMGSQLVFQRHGVELWDFDEDVMRDFGEIRRIAEFDPLNQADVDFMEENIKGGKNGGGAADIVYHHLSKFLKTKYAHPIELVCSTSVKVRAASAKFRYDGSGRIPGNTLFHVDYASLEFAFDRLHNPEKQKQWRNPTYAPEGGKLVDVVNLWAPAKDEPVIDWPLGFVLPQSIRGNFTSVELVVDATAGSLRGPDVAGADVVWKKNMKWGQGFVFKASAKASEVGTAKTIPFHGAFRMFPPTDYERRSFEGRCSVFDMRDAVAG